MSRARDEAGNIWEVDAQGNPVRLIQAAPQANPEPAVNPTYEVGTRTVDSQVRRSDAEASRAGAGAQVDQATVGAQIRKADADARKAEVEAAIAEMDELTSSRQPRGRAADQRRAGQTVLRSVTRALELMEEVTPGDDIASANMRIAKSKIAGTPEYQLFRQIEDFKRNIGLDRLQTMRENSPTGGALGQVPVQQQAMLEDTLGSFHLGQPIATIRENLYQLNNNYLEVMYGTPPEREYLIEQGILDPTLAARVQDMYYETEFDEFGRRRNPNAPPANDDEEGGLHGRVTYDPDEWDETGNYIGPQPGDWNDSLASQSLSGFNEGLAGTMGLPVDLATMGMNLIPQGLNAVANANIPTIQDPFMGGDWMRDRFSDMGLTGAESDDPTNQFARRAAQSVGASAIPVGGFANNLRQGGIGLASALGGGIGGATAQRNFPDNMAAELAGELLGSGGVGAGAMMGARRQAQRGIEDAVPSIDDLKGQAADVYARADQRGAVANPQQTQAIADDIRQTLRREGQIGPSGRISDADTSTTKAMNLIDQYAGQPMRPTEMNTVRRVIADGRQSADASDQRISKVMLDQFDDWVRPMVPDFDEARSISSRYLQGQDLEKARKVASANASTFSGSGFENSLRTQYRGLDRNVAKGRDWFSPDVQDAIESVNRGTTGSNIARGLGKLAPTGVVSGALGMGVPAMIGNAVGGPVAGAVAGLGAGALGYTSRNVATRMGLENARQAELIARNGGRLDQAPMLDPETAQAIASAAAGQFGQYLNRPSQEDQAQQAEGYDANGLSRRVGRPPAQPRGLFGRPY